MYMYMVSIMQNIPPCLWSQLLIKFIHHVVVFIYNWSGSIVYISRLITITVLWGFMDMDINVTCKISFRFT